MSAVHRRSPIFKVPVSLAAPLLFLGISLSGQSHAGVQASISPNAVPSGLTAIKLVLAQQADLSVAFALKTKAERGQYVYNALTGIAQQTQPAILQALSSMGLIGKGFYIANFIMVQAPPGSSITPAQIQQLQGRPDIVSIESVGSFKVNLPTPSAPPISSLPPGRGLEKNVSFINAPALWAQGALGQGITIGIVDSGVQWDHPLLRFHYRGFYNSGPRHSYNWWDAVHTTMTPGTNPCGVNAPAPCDDTGHGTHITGAAVGGNGEDYQIGVAPQSTFMACRDMDRGYASTGSAFEECMQFMLAPWDSTGANPDYTKAPDLVVHPFHCYMSGTNCVDDPVMHIVYWNLYAAGITSVVAAEDSGAVCGPVTDWPHTYPVAILTGALDYDEGTGQPSTTIAPYSSAGPGSSSAMLFKPDIASPGTNILSAVPGGNVAVLSGTSVASSQLAGAIALILSARPSLRGHPEQIWRLIGAVPPQVVEIGTCGSATGSPNYIFGWGILELNSMLAMANTN